MFYRHNKDSKDKKRMCSYFFKNKKTTALTIVLAFILSLGIISFITKTNVITYVAERILKELGIYTSEVRSIEIESDGYSSNTPGSWHIDKSAAWTNKDKVNVSYHFNSVPKPDENYKDIIIVFDISESMSGKKINNAKRSVVSLIEHILSYSNNRVALITYNNNSEVVSSFTNNKDLLTGKVIPLSASGSSNYNSALKNVDVVMDGYVKEENRDVATLFLTGGYPNVETSNQIGTYEMLKDKYPYMKIAGVQYGIGKDIIDDIREITDYQFAAELNSLYSILYDSLFLTRAYEKLQVVDYIDNDYFYVNSIDDIKVSKGEVAIEEENGVQKIIWSFNSNSFYTGSNAYMNISLTMKDEYINNKGYYPISQKGIITYKLPKEDEKVVNSSETPVLKNSYNVIYDTNPPAGCSINNITEEEHFVYENVTKRSDTLTCDGWQFVGWEIVDDITKVNDDVFVMPDKDVNIRGTWTRPNISKSMDGTVHQKSTLYKEVERAYNNNERVDLYTGNGADSFANKVYYYNDAKGITNNNVIFGGFCWEIVRTTETGGVKLLYNGLPSSIRTLEQSEYVNVVNDTSYPYEFDSTDNKWKNNNEMDGSESIIEFSVSTPGKYDLNYNAISSFMVHVYKNGEVYDTLSGVGNGFFNFNYLDSSYVISIEYINDCHDPDDPGGPGGPDDSDGPGNPDVPEVPELRTGYTCDDFLEFSLSLRTDSGDTACVSDELNGQIGSSEFNINGNSIASVGYMYNPTSASNYSFKKISAETYDIYTSFRIDEFDSYYYGDTAVYDGSNYVLKNSDGSSLSQMMLVDNYNNIMGKYRCSDGTTTTCSELYYIADANKYGIQEAVIIKDGQDPKEAIKMTLGSSVTKNENGTYSINNPVTITKADWYVDSESYYNYYICSNQTSTTCEEMYLISNTGDYRGDDYVYWSSNKYNYKYGNSFTYKNGKYELSNERQIWDLRKDSVSGHYACFDESCTQLSYVYFQDEFALYYIDLPGEKTIVEVLNEMLWDDSVNTQDSTVKEHIDTWYEANMKDYTERFEDTVFCNDRRVSSLGGWDPNGTSLDSKLIFEGSARNSSKKYDLTCPNINDRFTTSTSNGNGKLTYPVGLLTVDESGLSNIDRGLLGSPSVIYEDGAYMFSDMNDNYRYGYVRPSVSLKPGTEYVSGNGSSKNPYVVQ